MFVSSTSIAYCRRRLWDVEAAEDATSTVFTKALSGIATFGAVRGSFRSWLFAITHHTVVDEIRARQRTDLQLHATSRIESADADRRPGPESSLIADEGVAEIVSLLTRLPPDYARVIELRLAGLSDGEIGQVLGRSRVAVRIVHHRALKRLSSLIAISEEELLR